MSSSDLEDVKSTIRAVLVSSQNRLTIEELRREYVSLEGREIPFREFGYRTVREFLLSNPDIVELQNPSDNNSIVYAKSSQKTAHIENLVSGQKQATKKPPRFKSRPSYYNSAPRPPRFSRYANDTRFSYNNNNNNGYSTLPRRTGPPRLMDVQANRKEPLTHDFRVAVRDLLDKYPNGMPNLDFETEIGRLRMNYHYDYYSTDDVLDSISDFAYKQLNHVYRRQVKSYAAPPQPEVICISDSNSEEIEDVDEMSNSDTDYHQETNKQPSDQSKKESRCPSEGSDEIDARSIYNEELVNPNLIRSLRSLFDDPKNHNGIWLVELASKFQEKYYYALQPREHNFRDMMDLVTNLPSVFNMKQYRLEGDYYLRDARKYKTDTETTTVSEIPRSFIDELKKLLKNKKSIFTDELFREYEKMYRKTIKLESYGFTTKDEFLMNLENVCGDVKFRTVNSRTQMMLECTRDEQESEKLDALPVEKDYYNPIPKEACENSFSLPEQSGFEDFEIGEEFAVVLGEIYTPARFYVHLKEDINTLDSMMEDLHAFYQTNESQYTVYSATVTRNLLCACLYRVDHKWHRVRILQTKLADAKVSFIDYGTSDDVNISQLRYLHKDFSRLPAMCMRAKLAGIKPKADSSQSGVYGREVGYAFYDYTNGDGLKAKLVKYDPKCLEVHLYRMEPSGKTLFVHEELIKQGLVDSKTSEQSPKENSASESGNGSAELKDWKSDSVKINENIKEVTAAQKPHDARSVNVESRPFVMATAPPGASTIKQIPQGPPPGFPYSPATQIPLPPQQVQPHLFQSAQFNTVYNNFQNLAAVSPNVSPPFYTQYVYQPPPPQPTHRPPPGFEFLPPMYGEATAARGIPTVPAAAIPNLYSHLYNPVSDVNYKAVNHNESCVCALCPDRKTVPAGGTTASRSEISPDYVSPALLEKFQTALDVKNGKNIANNRISESSRERIGVESKLNAYFELESCMRDSRMNSDDSTDLSVPKRSNSFNKSHNGGLYPETKPNVTSATPLPEKIVYATEFIPKVKPSKSSNMGFAEQTFTEPRSTSSPNSIEGKKPSKLSSIRDLVMKHNKNVCSSPFN